jgi:hypothetical protein
MLSRPARTRSFLPGRMGRESRTPGEDMLSRPRPAGVVASAQAWAAKAWHPPPPASWHFPGRTQEPVCRRGLVRPPFGGTMLISPHRLVRCEHLPPVAPVLRSPGARGGGSGRIRRCLRLGAIRTGSRGRRTTPGARPTSLHERPAFPLPSPNRPLSTGQPTPWTG